MAAPRDKEDVPEGLPKAGGLQNQGRFPWSTGAKCVWGWHVNPYSFHDGYQAAGDTAPSGPTQPTSVSCVSVLCRHCAGWDAVNSQAAQLVGQLDIKGGRALARSSAHPTCLCVGFIRTVVNR